MLNKTKAIVLRYVKYGESSIIATIYTEKFGRIACIINGVHSKRARLPVTLFQPLTLIETDCYYRQNKEIQRLKDASCAVHYLSIPFDISKSTITLFLSEVLYLSLREEESNPVLFAFIYHAMQLLDTSNKSTGVFHIWFMLHLSRYLGFYPLEQKDGHFSVSADAEAFYALSPDALIALRLFAENSQGPPEMHYVTSHARNELLERIIVHYARHIDGFSRLNSFHILREVFSHPEGK
jgi:DNA repair protein RecO (recombination protein O)